MRLRRTRPNDHVSTTRSERGAPPRPTTTLRRVAAALALALALAWPAAADGRAAADDGVDCAGGLEAADLNEYFGQQRAGLWGADYQRAIPLPDGRVLWLFQDAYLATGAGTTLVHNAGLIQSGTCFTLLAGRGSSEWLMGDATTRYRHWFWPMGGEYNPHTDTVDVMVAELHETTSTYLTHAVPTATWRVSLRLPDLTVVDAAPAPDSSADLYGWSIASDDAHTYLFAHCYRQFGFDEFFTGRAHDQSCSADVTVGRVPRGRLDLSPEYWNGMWWSDSPADAISVIPANHAQRFVNPAQVMFDGEQWIAVTKAGDWWGDLVFVDVAPSPVGPWATYYTFSAPTKCADCNTYFASWVPWTTANGDLIVGISHNRWDGRKSEVYRPTFFEVPAPPDTHEPTSLATSFEPARRLRHG